MNCSPKRISALVLAVALVSVLGCGPTEPEPIDPAHLSGHWELKSNDETEWFDLAEDGSFTATIDRDGFIATTLAQGPHVTVEGKWQLAGRTITFELTDSSDPNLVGQSHAYEIIELTNRSMETIDASGSKKTLLRGL